MEIFSIIVLVVVLALLLSAFRVLREYERGVVFMLGRFHKVKGPGLIIIVPIIQQMVRVDLRTLVMDIPTQDLITRDNVSVKVNAVLYFRLSRRSSESSVCYWVPTACRCCRSTMRGWHSSLSVLS